MMLSLISLAFLVMLLGACASIMHDLTRPLAAVSDRGDHADLAREVARIRALPRARPHLVAVTARRAPRLQAAPLAAAA